MKHYQETYDNMDAYHDEGEGDSSAIEKNLVRIHNKILEQEMDGVDALISYLSSDDLGKNDCADLAQAIFNVVNSKYQDRNRTALSRVITNALLWQAGQEI